MSKVYFFEKREKENKFEGLEKNKKKKQFLSSTQPSE